MKLYLASASPRRMELLRAAGYDPQRVDQQAPEERMPGEPPATMVLRLAREKALWAAERFSSDQEAGLILGADTAVVIDDRVLGKPCDDADARRMLQALSGRRHQVLSGVHLIGSADRRESGGVELTAVRFGRIPPAALNAYIASGLPRDKAGSYGIQDLDGRWEVEIEGLRSNVIGLPVERLAGWFAALRDDAD